MSALDDVRTTVGVIDGLRAKLAQAGAERDTLQLRVIRLAEDLVQTEAELAALREQRCSSCLRSVEWNDTCSIEPCCGDPDFGCNRWEARP